MRLVVRWTRRRRGQLHRLELVHADDPLPIEVLHQLEVGPAAGEGLAFLVVGRIHVVEHSVPGPQIGRVVEFCPLSGAQGAAGRLGRRMGPEMAQDVSSPVVRIVECDVAVEDVEQAEVGIVTIVTVIASRDDESPRSIIYQERMACKIGCPPRVKGHVG